MFKRTVWLMPTFLLSFLSAQVSNVDFATQVNPIFQAGAAGCAAGGCHGTAGNFFILGTDATANYNALVNVLNSSNSLDYIEPGNTAASYLYLKITGDQSISGSRMPLGNSSYFDDHADQLETIRVWIEEGALPEAAPTEGTLTLDLTGMTPHLGQLFELRVVDQSDGSEVGQVRVDSIDTLDFSVSVPGLAIGGSYNVDFYADLNGNGVYDAPGADHAWRLVLTNVQGDTTLAFAHNTDNFVDIAWPGTVGIVSATGGLPEIFALQQNYPNPFNPSTQIRYDLPRAVPVTLTVYDLLGREVVVLVDARQSAGSYTVRWNGRNRQGKRVGTGVYLYRIQAGPLTDYQRMVLLR
ncbi:MAG: T9SS type A sorting domain-containing protein [Candidatus Marinimicrobia bacterium]|nr:T9SS type A sorting domain-containing protein [Candidatus Neomarinimicrobiota bacterium]